MRTPELTPLAERMRPRNFDDIVGQQHLVGPQSLLRALAHQNRFQSLVLWGPPGCGKTTLAKVMASISAHETDVLCAVHASVKDLRQVIQKSMQQVAEGSSARLLLLDEIHRLSKNQQDVLLPHLEDGSLKMIGTTTENPAFEVNPAIRSRSLMFRLQALSDQDVESALQKACDSLECVVSRTHLQALAQSSQGDMRTAYQLLDAFLVGSEAAQTEEEQEAWLRSLPLLYGQNSQEHFDTLSAMIKSIRHSRRDAAIYYLARLLEGGCDPAVVARRLVVSASEDVGNANPHALNIAVSGLHAAQQVGMPEVRIVLSQVCLFLACSPKSQSSYRAISAAQNAVQQYKSIDIPGFLKNNTKQSVHPESRFLPQQLENTVFYQPSQNGHEKNF